MKDDASSTEVCHKLSRVTARNPTRLSPTPSFHVAILLARDSLLRRILHKYHMKNLKWILSATLHTIYLCIYYVCYIFIPPKPTFFWENLTHLFHLNSTQMFKTKQRNKGNNILSRIMHYVIKEISMSNKGNRFEKNALKNLLTHFQRGILLENNIPIKKFQIFNLLLGLWKFCNFITV